MLYSRVIKEQTQCSRTDIESINAGEKSVVIGETAMVERIRNGREYNLKCHPLQELKIGEMVQVQNQVGPHPR